MDSGIITLLIFAIIVFGYLLDLFLGYLNSTRWSDTLPDEVRGIYDEEKYRRQQQYERTNYRFKLVTGTFSFILMVGMLAFGGFSYADRVLSSLSSSEIVRALLFFGVLGLIFDLISTPFDLYDTFVIEERFGFNTTTIRTWLFDKLKGWLMALVLGGGLLSLIIWVFLVTGPWFWIIAWAIISFFSLFFNYFYTVVIVPIFNKLTPLEDGELRNEIASFSGRVGFGLKNIMVMDGSKRSTHGNAYFSGFGKQKKIVLFDTLINEHSVKELVAILAHEIGHYKKKHVLKGLIISILHTGILLLLLSWFIDNPLLSAALGADKPSFHMGLLAFGILYSPISTILGMFMNVLSRKHEYEADQFAAVNYSSFQLQHALIRLSVKNLSNLTPHPWYVFVNYSHPTLLQRLAFLGKFPETEGAEKSAV